MEIKIIIKPVKPRCIALRGRYKMGAVYLVIPGWSRRVSIINNKPYHIYQYESQREMKKEKFVFKKQVRRKCKWNWDPA